MYDDVIIGGKSTTAREYTSEKGPCNRRPLPEPEAAVLSWCTTTTTTTTTGWLW